MVQRRIVHKMFDAVKCEAWQTLLSDIVHKKYNYLVLRDCFLSFRLICEPSFLAEVLNSYMLLLSDHLTKCQVSNTKIFIITSD